MKRSMTEAQFEQVTKNLDLSTQTLEIAFGVLVKGEAQVRYVREFNLTSGAVSQAVSRVWRPFESAASIPRGFQRVTAILPEHQAFIVMKWSRAALKKMENPEAM